MQINTFAIPHHVLDAHLPRCSSHDVFNASFVAIDVIVWSQHLVCTTSQTSWMNSHKLRWNSETTMQRFTLSKWVRDSALAWCRRNSITWYEQLRKVVGRCLADDAQRNTRSNYDCAIDLRQIIFVNVATALTNTKSHQHDFCLIISRWHRNPRWQRLSNSNRLVQQRQ